MKAKQFTNSTASQGGGVNQSAGDQGDDLIKWLAIALIGAVIVSIIISKI